MVDEKREIKYRCFDKTANKWVYFNGLFGHKIPEHPTGTIMLKVHDLTEPEEFAGIKDKNGKEVFDGDIINCWD